MEAAYQKDINVYIIIRKNYKTQSKKKKLRNKIKKNLIKKKQIKKVLIKNCMDQFIMMIK